MMIGENAAQSGLTNNSSMRSTAFGEKLSSVREQLDSWFASL